MYKAVNRWLSGMGKGAIIALGNHKLKGNCELFNIILIINIK